MSSVPVSRMERTEEGSVVEKVILTAIFAALAITVGAIIVAKVTAKANSINLN
jgi:cell division protein FtsL